MAGLETARRGVRLPPGFETGFETEFETHPEKLRSPAVRKKKASGPELESGLDFRPATASQFRAFRASPTVHDSDKTT